MPGVLWNVPAYMNIIKSDLMENTQTLSDMDEPYISIIMVAESQGRK